MAISKKSIFFVQSSWNKKLTHVLIIFTKFHEDWTNVVDFSLMANFWTCPIFFPYTLSLQWKTSNQALKNVWNDQIWPLCIAYTPMPDIGSTVPWSCTIKPKKGKPTFHPCTHVWWRKMRRYDGKKTSNLITSPMCTCMHLKMKTFNH